MRQREWLRKGGSGDYESTPTNLRSEEKDEELRNIFLKHASAIVFVCACATKMIGKILFI